MPVFAYCLMSNHVHLLIQADAETMSQLFRKMGTSYAYYFNSRYAHTGHVFQNRYKSEPLYSEEQFLAVLKYILLNPAAAGLGDWKHYRWSSAAAYLENKNDQLTACAQTWQFLSMDKLPEEFFAQESEIELKNPVKKAGRANDEEVGRLACRLGGLSSPIELQTAEKKKRNAILAALKSSGASVRQIERVTGINRNIIQRAK